MHVGSLIYRNYGTLDNDVNNFLRELTKGTKFLLTTA